MRLRIDECGDPAEREVFGPSRLGKGAWPDGIAFDSYGNLWGTLVYSDKLFVLTPQGDLRSLLDEGDPEHIDGLEQACFRGNVTEAVLFPHGPGDRAMDGERDLRRAGPADGLHRFAV
jgi:gluconolactonase